MSLSNFSKRILGLLLIAGLALFITACGTESSDEQGTSNDQSAEEADTLEVTMEVEEVVEDDKVTFEGETNLPEDTQLLVTLTNEDGYNTDSHTQVNDGTFTTDPFVNRGELLESGEYTVTVTLGNASTQPESVQEVIGENFELLTGDLVEDGTVTFTTTVDIEGAERIDHNALIDEYKEEITAHYENLNATYETQTDSYDEATWSEFTQEFREETDTLKDEIQDSALYSKVSTELGSSVAYLQMLMAEYTADLEDRGNDESIARYKNEVEEIIN